LQEKAEKHHTGAEVEVVAAVVQMEGAGLIQMEDHLQEVQAAGHLEEEAVLQEQEAADHLPEATMAEAAMAGATMAGAKAEIEVHHREAGAVHQADVDAGKAALPQGDKNWN
jgi:hypothetical protein